MAEFLQEPARKRRVRGNWDVLVCGGGMSGVVAAVAAARQGAHVALLEGKAFLGGVGTMGLPFQGFFDASGRQIVQGISTEFIERMRRIGGAGEKFIDCELHNPFLVVDTESVKLVCQEMVLDAGVELHLHTVTSDVLTEDGRISALFAENKSGREAYIAGFFVDATGDGDVAARAGVPYSVGRDSDGLTQSATLVFRLDGVEVQALTRRVLENPEKYDLIETLPRRQFRFNRKHIMVGLRNLIEDARSDGFEGIPWDRVCYITLLDESAVAINMVHVRGELGSEAEGLTNIEIKGRAQIPTIIRFLKEYVPGFENARLTSSAAWSGIRETRHVHGAYILTETDVRTGARFPDSIGVGGYPIDIHSPSADDVSLAAVPAYDIPYRCTVPRNVSNLLVAGRCISATHVAMASARVMATCMAVAHGVGIAAALGSMEKQTNAQVDIGRVQDILRLQGAYLRQGA
jgi:hypothetical protein